MILLLIIVVVALLVALVGEFPMIQLTTFYIS